MNFNWEKCSVINFYVGNFYDLLILFWKKYLIFPPVIDDSFWKNILLYAQQKKLINEQYFLMYDKSFYGETPNVDQRQSIAK